MQLLGMKEMETKVRMLTYALRKELEKAGLDMYPLADVTVTRRCTRRLGLCHYNKRYDFNKGKRVIDSCNIVISDLCFHNTKNCLRDTILHELVHTVKGCQNHRAPFHNTARKVMRLFPDAHIDTYCSKEESQKLREFNEQVGRVRTSKYRVTCDKCGCSWEYKRKTKLVTALLEGRKHGYRHTKCGCHDFSIEVL